MWAFDNLPVPHVHTDLPGPNGRSLLARDQQYASPSYTRVYPLFVERGSGVVIEDVDGNRFLDFTAGIAVTAAGHCHPEVVAAVQDQAGKLLHMSGTDFYYRPQIDLAEKLAKIAPGPSPKRVFFTNSGAEAVEAALKLARWHTGRSRAVAFFGAFHGRTYGAMSLSGSKVVHRRGFAPLVPEIHHVAFPRHCAGCDLSESGGPTPEADGAPMTGLQQDPTTFRMPGSGAGSCRCVAEIEDTLFRRVASPDEVAAIFVEPIQGEGGYYPSPPGFLKGLRDLCDRHGIMLVADEVQSGMGRTGKMFAIEHWGVEPDVICLAKGIASGLPLGAIVARAEEMDWPPGSHASTFGGNPVACRAALATIELLERGHTNNAAERGVQLREGLRRLQQEHGCIANVRGLGLMTAADVVQTGTEPLYDPTLRDRVVQAAFRRGLLLLPCGESALRFCPPLCVTAEQVETCLSILGGVLTELAPEPADRGRRTL